MEAARRIRSALAGFLLLLAFVAAARAQAPQILLPGPAGAAGSSAAQPAPRGVPMTFDAARMFALARGAHVELTLPDGSRHPYVFELAQEHGDGIRSWIGRHRDRGSVNRVVVTSGPGGAYGTFSTPRGDFRLEPGAGSGRLVDTATDPPPPPRPPDDALIAPRAKSAARLATPAPFLPREGVDSVALPKATPTPSYDVDLMVIYNGGFATQVGAANVMTQLQFYVTRTNVALADSEVAVRLRLVRASQVTYEQRNDDLVAIYNVTPGCRNGACAFPFDEQAFGHVEAMRAAVGADLVMFIRDGFGSGRAWVGFEPPNPLFMYSLVSCTQACEHVFAHELGHSLGLQHDRATTAWQAGGTPSYPRGVRPFAFGYAHCASGALTCNPEIPPASGGCNTTPQCSTFSMGNFSDIMAYFDISTRKNHKFSNPRVTCAGDDGVPQPCGIADPAADSADAAQAVNEFRASLSAIKATVSPTPPDPTFVRFPQAVHAVRSTDGTVRLAVERQSSMAGTAQVRWRTRDGTATAGADYAAAEGVLAWGDGDATVRFIDIPVVAGVAEEGIEYFHVDLVEPSGSGEVYVDAQSSASVAITEPWPLGGALPPGFEMPAGSDAAWGVDPEVGFDAGGSLRSGVAFTGNTGPGDSDLAFTGDFIDGYAIFAYRTSMFPHPRTFFEFSIDGAVTFQQGGESGFRLVRFPVKAGRHTLRWSVRNFENTPCAGQPGSSAQCADRAWIDVVALPVVRAAATVALASSANPSVAGQAVIFTASVSGGSGTASGSVAFTDGGAAIAECAAPVPLQSGTASCTTASLAAGSRSIAARYSGDARYAGGATATLVQTVGAAPPPPGSLAFEPGSVQFDTQSMGATSLPLSVRVTNTGGTAVQFTALEPTAQFGGSLGDCTTLQPGASCTLRLTFTPDPVPGMALGGTTSVSGSFTVRSDAALGPHVVPANGSAEKSLVSHYYHAILRRLPDPQGHAFWSGEAQRTVQLGANVNEAWFAMAQAFYTSAEYAAFNRDDTGFVTDLYTTFFNRAPDAAGLAHWTGQLAQGMPREVLLASFMFSAEFVGFTQGIFGNTAVRAEIDLAMDFYRGLLARLPDGGGFAHWLGRFRGAQCQGGDAVNAEVEAISSAFAQSAEYAARGRGNAQYVGDLYNAFLRRGGDLDGVRFWIGQVESGARSREDVRRAFVASPEFQARVQAVLNEGCMQ